MYNVILSTSKHNTRLISALFTVVFLCCEKNFRTLIEEGWFRGALIHFLCDFFPQITSKFFLLLKRKLNLLDHSQIKCCTHSNAAQLNSYLYSFGCTNAWNDKVFGALFIWINTTLTRSPFVESKIYQLFVCWVAKKKRLFSSPQDSTWRSQNYQIKL